MKLKLIALILTAGVCAQAQVANVSCGDFFTMALKTDGTVKGTGRNDRHQLGNGNNANQPLFTSTFSAAGVPLANMNAVSGGSAFSLGLSNGVALSWGYNANGRLGDGTSTERTYPVRVSGITNAIAIDAGANFGLALLSDHTVKSWGGNAQYQLADGTTTDRNTPVQVQADSDYYFPGNILPGVVAVSAGYNHCLALRDVGDVFFWGNNTVWSHDRARVPTSNSLPFMFAIAAGSDHDLSISSNGIVSSGILAGRTYGDVYAWGRNLFGQVGNNSNVDQMFPGVLVLSNIVAVAGGSSHSLALDTNGVVWAWGLNTYGQLARGEGPTAKTTSYVPVQTVLTNVVQISAGDSITMAVLADGSVAAAGRLAYGALGLGVFDYVAEPLLCTPTP
ncbi:MAG: repeat domain protein [Verrucomicrobiales bacterium]|nr:repeat domain protein [Verrucomicrobiales bacterium]